MNLGSTKREDRSRALRFLTVGTALRKTAEALDDLGEREYGNGLAIVAIHAAIAYTDALTVAYRELRSVDGDHARAASVLSHALGARAQDQVPRLTRMLNAKSDASYSGSYYTLQDGREILRDLKRYASWAEEMLEQRPAAAHR
jgi:hypothetical protein